MRSAVCLVGLALSVSALASDAHASDAGSARPQARIERDAVSGWTRLVVAGPSNAATIRVTVSGLCRYDPKAQRWSRDGATPVPKVTDAGTLVEITNQVGLYWLEWTENGRKFAAQVTSGPVLCNDVMIAPPQPPGMVRACIPLGSSARAGYVPDPVIHCR